MQIGVLTRSKTADYVTLPCNTFRWWDAPHYRRITDFERLTIIVETTSKQRQRYLITGIISGRRDFAGTIIRYTVFGTVAEQNELTQLLTIISASLTPHGRKRLGELLDQTIGVEVETFISDIRGSSNTSDTAGILHSETAILDHLEKSVTFIVDEIARESALSNALCATPQAECETLESASTPNIIGIENSRLIPTISYHVNEQFHGGNGIIAYLNLAEENDYATLPGNCWVGILSGSDVSIKRFVSKRSLQDATTRTVPKALVVACIVVLLGCVIGISLNGRLSLRKKPHEMPSEESSLITEMEADSPGKPFNQSQTTDGAAPLPPKPMTRAGDSSKNNTGVQNSRPVEGQAPKSDTAGSRSTKLQNSERHEFPESKDNPPSSNSDVRYEKNRPQNTQSDRYGGLFHSILNGEPYEFLFRMIASPNDR